MNLVLPSNATSAEAQSWLRLIVQEFGLGFHPDSDPVDYVLPNGRHCFTPDQCDSLRISLDQLFAILGDELPYEICSSEASAMLAKSLGMKPPLEYHDRDYQQELLSTGTREQLIEWLCWNDPNGVYTDKDSTAEDQPMLSLGQAREIMFDQIMRDSSV